VTPDWYDLLDVPRDASPDVIRAAWKAAVADLDPTDRGFRVFNQAAEVLLDPAKRAAYDATLAPVDEPADEPADAVTGPVEHPTVAVPAGRAGWAPPTWLLIGLALLTLAVASAAAYLTWKVPSDEAMVEATTSAQQAAESAVVPVLSIDYQRLDEVHDEAVRWLTPDFREKYEKTFTLVRDNAPATKTVVEVDLVASAITRTDSSGDRAEILLFVDRPTTNKKDRAPVVYRDQVTLVMERDGDRWLVDDMRTSPPAG
jgi:Mce-associated membrane protein